MASPSGSGSGSQEIEEVDESKALLSTEVPDVPPRVPENPPPVGIGNNNNNNNNNNNGRRLTWGRIWKRLKRTFIRCCTRSLSLSEKSSATCMAFISNIAVMGIVTLNIYSASYFLAWKKEGSTCHVFPDADKEITEQTNGLIQVIVIGLPFVCFPLALCIGGLAEVAKEEPARWLQWVAGLVMVEMVYIVFLGAVMTLCMSDVVGTTVAIVTATIVGVFLLFWGWCCNYPTCWRYVMLCKCLCSDIDQVKLEDLV